MAIDHTETTDECIQFEGERPDVLLRVNFSVLAAEEGIVFHTKDRYRESHQMPPLPYEQVDELVAWLQQRIAEHRLEAEPPGELVFVVDTIGVSCHDE